MNAAKNSAKRPPRCPHCGKSLHRAREQLTEAGLLWLNVASYEEIEEACEAMERKMWGKPRGLAVRAVRPLSWHSSSRPVSRDDVLRCGKNRGKQSVALLVKVANIAARDLEHRLTRARDASRDVARSAANAAKTCPNGR